MKKLEIIIKPERLEDLKTIFQEAGVKGLMVSNVLGCGNQMGYVQIYRGVETQVNLLPKIKVETVVSSEMAEKLIEQIEKEIATGNFGDGKIFIYEVEDAIRIRTGDRGEKAL